MVKIVILDKDDINNPLHPDMWERLMEDFGLPMETTRITMKAELIDCEIGS